MKHILRHSMSLAATLALLASPALAQQHQQNHGAPQGQHPNGPGMGHPMAPPQHQNYATQHNAPPHGNWRKGDHYNGQRQVVDWQHHHLHQPPQGYEWVQSGPNFVLIAVGTGIIASIIANSVQ